MNFNDFPEAGFIDSDNWLKGSVEYENEEFRVSGTQETVEGAGANEVSGVLSEVSCCRCGAPLIKKKRPTIFSRPLMF